MSRPLVTGIELFASGPRARLARRPSDVALALSSLVLVLATGVLNAVASPSEPALASALQGLPNLLEPVWRVSYFAAFGWLVIVAGAAMVRRRVALLRNIALAVLLAFVV